MARMNKNTRVNNPQPNNMKPHGNQATRCNCPSCTSFIPHPGSLGHRNPQDVQDTIDYQWHLLKAQPDLKRFLLENPPELSLRKLVDYWSHPKRIVNARNGGEIVSVTSGGSLFLALHYLFLGKVAEARALLMNGAFLGQCFHKQIEEIVEICRHLPNLKDDVVKEQMPYFHSGFHATSSLESMDKFLRRALPPHFLKQMSHASHAAKTKDKTVDFISSSWKSSISSSLSPAAQQNRKCREQQHQQQEESTIEIVFKDAATNQEVNMTIGISTMLKHVFTNYSEECGISLRSSRFVYQGKTLFLSSVGHKTPAQLGMQNLDVILSSCTSNNSNKSSPSTMGESRSQSQQHPSSAIKQRRNNKSKAKSKKRSPKSSKISSSCSSVINTLDIHHDDQCKIDHSKNLSRLFEEAEVQFKEIRQRLHALNIERTKPKIKTSHKKKSTIATATTANLINNPSMDGLGGKAGKTRFVVQVGEVNNLYKTSKPSHEQQHQQHSIVTTDLHGLTKQEALTKLNECLPQWTNLAMHGSYPFVQPVIIVCGGGNQILSETVDHWIKRNDTVSNAPKSSLIGGR